MSKRETAAEITALNGNPIDEAQYTQKELDAMLAEAQGVAPDAELLPGQPVEYTHTDGETYPGRIIRVNDAATGDVAVSVDALGTDARQMTVLKGSWKLVE